MIRYSFLAGFTDRKSTDIQFETIDIMLCNWVKFGPKSDAENDDDIELFSSRTSNKKLNMRHL